MGLLVIPALVSAATIRVKPGASGAGDGSSWANAYTDLQAALGAATSDDEIWVAAGTYKPTSGSDRTISFQLPAGAALYGGFNGTETARGQRNWDLNETILSGDLGTAGVNTDNSLHVVRGAEGAILDGVTVQDGAALNAIGVQTNSDVGGGILIQDASTTLSNCLFYNNAAMQFGGAVHCVPRACGIVNCTFDSNQSMAGGAVRSGGAILIRDSTFRNNKNQSGGNGGALALGSGEATLLRCLFDRNGVGNPEIGGAISISGSVVTISECVFTGNEGIFGGAIDGVGSGTHLARCVFAGNRSFFSGGAIRVRDGGEVKDCLFYANTAPQGGAVFCTNTAPTLVNCSFVDNSAEQNGGAFFNTGAAATPQLANCLLSGNTAPAGPNFYNDANAYATLKDCDIVGGGASGAGWDAALGNDGGGNIDADPLFVAAADPDGPDNLWRTADDGLALSASSPCINAGTVASASASDLLGNPRVGVVDIGAYEYQGTSPVPTPTPGPQPPSAPIGHLTMTFVIDTPSTTPTPQAGEIVYKYVWTSNDGARVVHGPTPSRQDTLSESALVKPGQTWTVTVTPYAGEIEGAPMLAHLDILARDPQSGLVRWIFYK